jgi:PAS domain S-box-containing protein
VVKTPLEGESDVGLEEFFDLSLDLLCIVGFDGHFRRVNATLERTLGYPMAEFRSLSVFEITHPDDREPAREALEQLAEGRDLVGFQTRVIAADGTVRWFEWNTRTQPELGVVYGVGRDVTERRKLADEHAALQRVATLVAQGAPPEELFANIVDEVGRLLEVDAVHLGGNHDGKAMSALAMWAAEGDHPPHPDRMPIKPGSLAWEIVRTLAPARKEDWSGVSGETATLVRDKLRARSSVAAPIVVDGRLWGAIAVHSRTQPLPPDTETRLERFAALVVTALTNAEARAEVRRLAEEQAALRRVATLVAEGGAPSAVFDAVTSEIAALLGASNVVLARYDDESRLTVVAKDGDSGVAVGEAFPLGADDVASRVVRSGRTERLDDLGEASGPIARIAGDAGVRSAVAAPVVVERGTWGVLAATWTSDRRAPDDTEERLTAFTELLGTAIANADSRDQLTASRARVLVAGDEARRRVVRDLHDGAQQRLVHTIIVLKLALRAMQGGRGDPEQLVAETLGAAERATSEVRELAHGILPSVLTRGGLRAGVEALVSRLDLPVAVDVADVRVPAEIEASACFVVAETLTNVVKHARATRATVKASVDDGALTLRVDDDGVGGADPTSPGLLGVADRVDALGGRLEIESVPGSGTVVMARLPLIT